MTRLAFGSTSCYLSLAAPLGLALIAVCKLMILYSAPGGTGDMTGINHLDWGIAIFLLLFAVPILGVTGILLGAVGIHRTNQRLANWGITLSVLAIVLSPVARMWALP